MIWGNVKQQVRSTSVPSALLASFPTHHKKAEQRKRVTNFVTSSQTSFQSY